MVRSVSLNVPQDSVEKPPASGDFEKMKSRRHSAYPRQDAVEDSSKPKSATPSPRAVRSTSTVAEIEKDRSPKLTGKVSRSGSGAGSGSKKTLQVPGQKSFDEEVEKERKGRKDSGTKLKLKIPLKTQNSVEVSPRGSLSPGISSSVPKGNNMLAVSTEISPKESPSGSKSKLNKKSSLEEKEKRGSKVSRSKSSIEKLDKTAKTQTSSLPLGDSKTYESPLTTALKEKSDPKKYTSRKKTAPI